MIGENIALEITYSLIFFSYGLVCSMLYYIVCFIEKRMKPKSLTYILDCIYVTCCFIPFYLFYVEVLDGVLKLYELIFFILGFCVNSKYILATLKNIIIIKKKSCPTKVKQLYNWMQKVMKK